MQIFSSELVTVVPPQKCNIKTKNTSHVLEIICSSVCIVMQNILHCYLFDWNKWRKEISAISLFSVKKHFTTICFNGQRYP